MIERAERTNEAWLEELRDTGPRAEAAQASLRAVVAVAVRRAMAGRGELDDSVFDDLVQVALVHVLGNLGRFEGRSKFTTWAYAVAVRAALSELRKAAYRRAGQELSDEDASALESSAPAPERRAERSEIVGVLRRVIEEELTDRQRTAILGELAGTPREEVLESLGGNRNALYKLVHDARRRLREALCAAGICDDEVREAFDL